MKPEAILQSSMLDILFENRNKDYGAYALRKNYNKRLTQSLLVTFLLATIFFVLQNIQPKKKQMKIDLGGYTLVDIPLQKNIDKVEPPKEKPKQKKIVPTVGVSAPVIKPNIIETTVPDQDSINARQISTVTNNVRSDRAPHDIIAPTNGTVTKPIETTSEETSNAPLVHADVMPSFNGDIIKYMLKNLRQPNDLQDGERVMVRVQFIVNANGEISDVVIIQSGRQDLDEEVVRVVKKMPKWKPGMQAGKFVPVYFNLPVTFVSDTE